VTVLDRSVAASVFLQRARPAVLMLLWISEKVREMQLGKARRTAGIRGFRGNGKPRIRRCPEVLSSKIWSSFDLAPWRRFAKIRRGKMERGSRGIYRRGRESKKERYRA
jgi:hypothetical protein